MVATLLKLKNMKKLFVFTILLFSSFLVNAQYGNFRKYKIAETACFCYFPSNPGKFEEQQSEDGQLMYLAEVEVNENTFGIITVLLNESFSSTPAKELNDLLVSYMDYLKQTFEITSSAGYGFGHTLESNPKAQGILDYWKDKNNKELVVKGWIDNGVIAFLYIRGLNLPNQNVQSLFLNGFIFKK
jgi:hypothetical protein